MKNKNIIIITIICIIALLGGVMASAVTTSSIEISSPSDSIVEISLPDPSADTLYDIEKEFISEYKFVPIIKGNNIEFLLDQSLLFKNVPYDKAEHSEKRLLEAGKTRLDLRSGIDGVDQKICIGALNKYNEARPVEDCNVVFLRFYNDCQLNVFGITFDMTPSDLNNLFGAPYSSTTFQDDAGNDKTTIEYFMEYNSNVYIITVSFFGDVMFDVSVNLNNTPLL